MVSCDHNVRVVVEQLADLSADCDGVQGAVDVDDDLGPLLLATGGPGAVGVEVDVMQIVKVQIPIALFAMFVNAAQTLIVDGRMVKKCYPDGLKTAKNK